MAGPGLIRQFLLRSCGSGLFGQLLVGPRHKFKGQLTDGSTSAQPLPTTVCPSLPSGGAHLSTLAQRSGKSTHLCGTMLETYRMVQNGLMLQALWVCEPCSDFSVIWLALFLGQDLGFECWLHVPAWLDIWNWQLQLRNTLIWAFYKIKFVWLDLTENQVKRPEKMQGKLIGGFLKYIYQMHKIRDNILFLIHHVKLFTLCSKKLKILRSLISLGLVHKAGILGVAPLIVHLVMDTISVWLLIETFRLVRHLSVSFWSFISEKNINNLKINIDLKNSIKLNKL